MDKNKEIRKIEVFYIDGKNFDRYVLGIDGVKQIEFMDDGVLVSFEKRSSYILKSALRKIVLY